MITCSKTDSNAYALSGLTACDLELIQEAIIRLFNESNRKEHRDFRTQVLQINRPIDNELEKLEKKL